MIYSNESVRRQDRLMDESEATNLLRTAEYGFLALSDTDGQPYGIPVNYAWDGKDSLYIHCAPEGRKLGIIDSNCKVSFCVVGRTHLLPSKFTTEYESIVLFGKAYRNLSDEEKWKALDLILQKLSPDDQEIGHKYAKGSFSRVEIIRIDVSSWSGKHKVVKSSH